MAVSSTAPVLLRDMTPDDIRDVRRIETAAYRDAWPSRIFENELENGFAHYRVAVQGVQAAQDIQDIQANGGADGRAAKRDGLAAALGRTVRGVVGRTTGRMLGGASDPRVVGFMGLWYMVDQVHLVTIAVDPAHQGAGLGQRLLLDCFDLAFEAELDEIVLEVRVSNQRARDLYALFGFHQAGILKDYYKDNHEDAVVMLSGPLDADARTRIQAIRDALREAHPELFAG